MKAIKNNKKRLIQETDSSTMHQDKKQKFDHSLLPKNLSYDIYRNSSNSVFVYVCTNEKSAANFKSGLVTMIRGKIEVSMALKLYKKALVMICNDFEKISMGLIPILASKSKKIVSFDELPEDYSELKQIDPEKEIEIAYLDQSKKDTKSEVAPPLNSIKKEVKPIFVSMPLPFVPNSQPPSPLPIISNTNSNTVASTVKTKSIVLTKKSPINKSAAAASVDNKKPTSLTYNQHTLFSRSQSMDQVTKLGKELELKFQTNKSTILKPLANNVNKQSPQTITDSYKYVFTTICGFIYSAFHPTGKNSQQNFFILATEYSKELKSTFDNDVAVLETNSDPNEEKRLIAVTTYENLYHYCQNLFVEITSIIDLLHNKEFTAKKLPTLQLTKNNIQILINSLQFLTKQSQISNENQTPSSSIIQSQTGFFNDKIKPRIDVDFKYTPEILQKLLLTINFPLHIIPVQHPYISQEATTQFQTNLAHAINISFLQNKPVIIPMQEFYEQSENHKDSIFLGSALLIRLEKDALVIKYIDPTGSCYRHESNTMMTNGFYAQYRNVEKDYDMPDIRTNRDFESQNRGIFLSLNASKFKEILNENFLNQIRTPLTLTINVKISGFIACVNEQQNIGGYLVACLVNEVFKRPYKKWSSSELIKYHRQLINTIELEPTVEMETKKTL